MAKQKRVGIIFSYNENWIAGTYYILNCIHALMHIDDNIKPNLVIFTDHIKNVDNIKEETGYPYLEYVPFPKVLNKWQRVVNKIGKSFGFEPFTTAIKGVTLDFLYPYQHKDIRVPSILKVYWIPDFQVEFLPQLFSEHELQKRKRNNQYIADNANIVVLSSKDAESHFWQLYPVSKARTFVLPFAVTHPDISGLLPKEILQKHKLPDRYFFAPNQFWIHKNHRLVLEAVALLKQKGENVCVAFSGKDFDFRNQDYINSLKHYIQQQELESHIRFLGFLDRKEQLVIMQEAIAVVQPSLFEGWSTVVEDAKALNKYILLSDLGVHKEQVQINVDFFDRKDPEKLASLLQRYNNKAPIVKTIDYTKQIERFANQFIALIS